MPVKTEAHQETKETPIGGCPWDNALKPDPDMADPFYEEYLDLGSLFPDLIPGFDMEPYELLSCPSELTSTKEDLPDINTLLAEADLSNVNPDVIEELLNVEVMDEAPFDQEQLDYSSSCVSSPGSANSTADSFATGTSTEVAAPEYVDMDAELQHLLDLLESTDAHDLTTIKANDLIPEVSSSKPVKRKLNAPDATPVAKRLKASVLAPTDQVTSRRIKNNAASKNCRASRKQKHQDMFAKEEELLKSNAELKAQIEELTSETEALRNILVQRLSGVVTV